MSIGLLAFAMSCTEPAGPSRDFAAARAQWSNAAPPDYEFTLQVSCFCAAESVRPLVIRVQNGGVVSARYADTGAAAAPSVVASAPTIDSLFARIDQALRAKADRIQADYDPALGFPRTAYIDYRAALADEEYGFTVSDFRQR